MRKNSWRTVLAIVALFSVPCDAQERSRKPNFVFIQGEGQGWASTSVQLDPNQPDSKSRAFLTPNLERLAQEGIRFSHFYAPSPRCTPSRATYLTGISPARLHMTFTQAGGDTGNALIEPRVRQELPQEVTTIAELLKAAGYATAHFGKWHVGRTDPRAHGFDQSDGANSNGGPEDSSNPNPKQAYAITEKGIDFIQRNAASGKPFYLQLSHYAGRSAMDAKPETLERVLQLGLGRDERNVEAAAAALDIDITIGMVLDTLDQLGIADKTYVIYTADHGTPGRNGPLQGGKGGLWDGGIRIPLFIRGPVTKAGGHCSALVTGADLVPTVADLAGASEQVPAEVEGGSLKAILMDPASGRVTCKRDELVFHFPHYDKDSLGPVSAIVAGNFKLIRVYEDGSRLLFDLSNDLGEQHDLAPSMPDKVRDLDARLTDYLAAVGADLPIARAGASKSAANDSDSQRDVLLEAIDQDKDGSISVKELDALPALLRSLDTNRDGTVSRDEARTR